MDESILNKISDLIKKNIGDTPRLEHIRDSIRAGKTLYSSDQRYLEALLSKHHPSEKETRPKEKTLNSDEKSVEELKKELGKTTEKIEKMEKKIDEQELKAKSYNLNKSEGATLVLAIILGLGGVMGVGHLYLKRIRRGIIILVSGFSIWLVAFVPLFLLGFLAEEKMVREPEALGPFLGLIFVVFGGWIAFLIWQILDSRKLCRHYNEYFEESGKAPW